MVKLLINLTSILKLNQKRTLPVSSTDPVEKCLYTQWPAVDMKTKNTVLVVQSVQLDSSPFLFTNLSVVNKRGRGDGSSWPDYIPLCAWWCGGAFQENCYSHTSCLLNHMDSTHDVHSHSTSMLKLTSLMFFSKRFPGFLYFIWIPPLINVVECTVSLPIVKCK